MNFANEAEVERQRLAAARARGDAKAVARHQDLIDQWTGMEIRRQRNRKGPGRHRA